MARVSQKGFVMAAITATTGIIDVQGIVDKLMTLENAPIDKLKATKSTIQTQISAFGSLKSELAAVQDAARKLYSVTTWNATTVMSANEDAVKVTSAGGAAKGAMSVSVQQLAQAQSASTGKFAAGDAVLGGGTLTIQMGSSAGGGFVADPARNAVGIQIKAGATLAEIRTAINNANAGVSASLVNDGGQVRLMLRSSETGEANAFSIDVQGAENGGAGGLGALAFTPGGGGTMTQMQAAQDAKYTIDGLGALAFTPGGGGAMTQMQAAQDAKYTIDGLELASSKNTVTNALDGVNLELRQVTTAPVGVEVKHDTEAMRAAVDAFVTAYNTLNASLTSLTKYDQATGTAGLFQGDFVVVQMQAKLRTMLGSAFTPAAANGGANGGGNGAGGAALSLTRLSDAGLEVQRDGSLKVNDTKFQAAAAEPTALRALFGATDTASPSGNGIARRMADLLGQVLGGDGAITGAIETLERRVKDNERRQTDLNSRMESTRARLVRQYSQLDANLQSMSGLSNSLSSQLAALNNNWLTK